jgi:hypothetical protein
METREYCNNVTLELAEWKAKVDGIVRKLDSRSTGEKEKVYYDVNGLHIVADELNERIDGLTRACMMNWAPARSEDHEVTWPEQSSRSWDFISQSDFGG